MRAIMPILIMLFVATSAARADDPVPSFSVEQICKAAVAASPGRAIEYCTNDESGALRQLEQNWSRFRPKDRTNCTKLSLLDGYPSYVELLTCLEMADEARTIKD